MKKRIKTAMEATIVASCWNKLVEHCNFDAMTFDGKIQNWWWRMKNSISEFEIKQISKFNYYFQMKMVMRKKKRERKSFANKRIGINGTIVTVQCWVNNDVCSNIEHRTCIKNLHCNVADSVVKLSKYFK